MSTKKLPTPKKKLPSPKKKLPSPKSSINPPATTVSFCTKSSGRCNLTSRSKFNKIVGFVSSPLSIPLWILAIVILLRLTK